jgi:D-psicose/D-tagatose/L-ribulose 3-epimerase
VLFEGQAMKIGVSAFAWMSDFSEKHAGLLPGIRESGLRAVEIAMFDPAKLNAGALRRVFEANDLEVTVCAILPEGINPISDESIVRRHSVQHLVRCIETAAEMGARLMGGPVYAPIGYLPGRRRNENEWRWAVECFEALGPLLDATEMTLCVEPVNRGETFFLTTAAEAREFCEAVGHPRVGITIDTFHANIEEKKIPSAVYDAGSRLKHVHASENDRGVLGTGHVDFPGLLQALEDTAYDGYLMIEGMGRSEEDPDATLALWKDRVATPEEIAFASQRYLQGLMR